MHESDILTLKRSIIGAQYELTKSDIEISVLKSEITSINENTEIGSRKFKEIIDYQTSVLKSPESNLLNLSHIKETINMNESNLRFCIEDNNIKKRKIEREIAFKIQDKESYTEYIMKLENLLKEYEGKGVNNG